MFGATEKLGFVVSAHLFPALENPCDTAVTKKALSLRLYSLNCDTVAAKFQAEAYLLFDGKLFFRGYRVLSFSNLKFTAEPLVRS